MIRFADPWMFIFLILLVPLFTLTHTSGGRISFSNLGLLKKVYGTSSSWFHPRMLLTLLRGLCLLLLITALARPQSGKKFSEVTSEGVDIMLALDTSGSMKALDFQWEGRPIDRLEVIKNVVMEFIKKRPNDRLGLVVFGSEAFTQCPLTLDHGIVMDFVKKISVGLAGEATAIGSGLGTSVKRMRYMNSKSKVIILLTDGVNNAGRIPPLKAAELAAMYGIKVYTIGVGSNGKVPFLVDTLFGKRYVYEKADLDDKTLKEISRITNARYFRATETKELDDIYNEIDRLEKVEIKVKEYTEYNELFPYFLVPGLILLLLEIILGQTRLRKIP